MLGGVGVDLFDWVRLDAGFGYFQQGKFERTALMIGQPVFSFGLSSRLTVRQGLPIQTSIDYKLYRNHPDALDASSSRETYKKDKFSWSVSAEYNHVWQQLESIEQYAKTKLQPAWAGAVQVQFKYDYMRIQLVGLIRNLEYILMNVPSLTPFVAIPEAGTSTTPEYFAAATIDYRFDSAHVTPFITGAFRSRPRSSPIIPGRFRSFATRQGVTGCRKDTGQSRLGSFVWAPSGNCQRYSVLSERSSTPGMKPDQARVRFKRSEGCRKAVPES